MRVLINAMQAGNQSGTGRYTEELIRHLLLLEDAPELTVWWPAKVPRPEWTSDVELVLQPGGLWKRLGLERAVHRWAGQYDVVHYPASIGPLDGGPNVVLTVHDCIFLRHPEWFRWERAQYYRWAGRRSARRAARIIADSETTARDVREYMGVAPNRVDVVPLGVRREFAPAPPEVQSSTCQRYGLPDRFFLYVGTLEPRKNLVRLIRAWDTIAGEVPEDLVIAGRDGWKTATIHDAIASATHRYRIHRPGFVTEEDLPPLLSATRAFVWPSLYEGFGLPVLEAMACGAAVLTSNRSSLPEVAGEAALLVNPEDESSIAGGLKALSGDGRHRAALAEAGIARAAKFTWRRCAEATRAVYRRVAEGPASGAS